MVLTKLQRTVLGLFNVSVVDFSKYWCSGDPFRSALLIYSRVSTVPLSQMASLVRIAPRRFDPKSIAAILLFLIFISFHNLLNDEKDQKGTIKMFPIPEGGPIFHRRLIIKKKFI